MRSERGPRPFAGLALRGLQAVPRSMPNACLPLYQMSVCNNAFFQSACFSLAFIHASYLYSTCFDSSALTRPRAHKCNRA